MISELAYIDLFGFHIPDYPTVLEALKQEYRALYGQDAYLENDSQDGQFLSIVALSQYELLALAAAVYNSFSPATASGDALSRNVKLNGIRRRVATFSTADVLVVGTAGTQILNGLAEDVLGQKWALPPEVVIPPSGQVVVTATAVDVGEKGAAANTINKISTPTLGWQTVNNNSAASPGAPVETDAELRARQSISTALPSLSVMEGIVGAVADLDGVTRLRGYENDSDATNSDGIPAHSISLVVEGGDSAAIALSMARHKTPGTGTYGTTAILTYDSYGVPNVMRFYRPTPVALKMAITLKPLNGYVAITAAKIQAAVADMVNNLPVGEDVLISKLYVPANLPGTLEGATFNITSLTAAKMADALVALDVSLPFNAVATIDPANIIVNVTP